MWQERSQTSWLLEAPGCGRGRLRVLRQGTKAGAQHRSLDLSQCLKKLSGSKSQGPGEGRGLATEPVDKDLGHNEAAAC